MEKNKQQRGYTLIMSLLVTTMILSVGFGVFEIVVKEVQFSGAGRESQKAFYAADGGVECVLYWDFKHKSFATTTPHVDPLGNITCAGRQVNGVSGGSDDGGLDVVSFKILFGDGSCAKVEVKKDTNKTVPSHPMTTVTSRGYNFGDSDPAVTGECTMDDSRQVERGLQVEYSEL